MVIEIVEYETDKVVRTIECGASKSHTEKVDDGLNINLDHDRFFTRIVPNGEK